MLLARAAPRLAARRVAPVRSLSAALPRATTWAARRPGALAPRAVAARCFSVEDVPVPSMGDSITEGTVAEWSVEVGDTVAVDDIVVMIETDKVSVEVRAPVSGAVTELLAELDDVVEVGAPLFKIDTSVEVAAPRRRGAPAARRQRRRGGGARGAGARGGPVPAPTPAPAMPEPPKAAGSRGETRVKMNRMRQRIAERLKEAQNTAACLTTFQECDMGALMELRKAHKDEFEKVHGVKLGFMSAFVAASTKALIEIPAVNAYIDDDAKEIVYRDYCDVSVAVASPNGLVVPVLRNTEAMSFADVEKTIGAFGAKARAGALALEDMAGGTFTISNGGVFGSLMGTPIINPPQSAILGMHATKMRAVVAKDGSVVARPMMYLALTYDHRMIDGREAVTFLKSVANKIEDPARLLLDI
ncbi:dihydrolipoyllysine-residue succinyltransferase [Aureococcus anophagefferens]|nr:dihydrolipoyllysine-residue succinyltransferase [Aureococcus anophagefferens]